MDRINTIIHQIRREISKISEAFNSTTDDLVEFLSVRDKESYNSVIDSFYLLEDTELAKQEFKKIDFVQESSGRLYLFFYGVLNSCYMQQQAILVVSQKLGITQNVSDIKKSEVVSYRNDFAAHSPNRSIGTSEYSFILDRYAMNEGKVKGYTANHSDGIVFREADVLSLIKDWDCLLEKQLELVATRILNK